MIAPDVTFEDNVTRPAYVEKNDLDMTMGVHAYGYKRQVCES